MEREWQWVDHEVGANGAAIVDAVALPDRLILTGSDDDGGAAWVSFDGESWIRSRVPRTTPRGRAIESIGPVYETSYRLVALAFTDRSGFGGPPLAVTSNDGGETWELEDEFEWPEDGFDGGGRVADVIALDRRFVAVGHTLPGWAIYLPYARVWTSNDGFLWRAVDTEEALGRGLLGGAAIGGSEILAFGTSLSTSRPRQRWVPGIARSADGVSWETPSVLSDDSGAVLDVIQLSSSPVELAAGVMGDSPEETRGAVWSLHGTGDWSRELLVDAPSEMRVLHELVDGTALAFGTQRGRPVMWHRSAEGHWEDHQLIGDDSTWVRAALEFKGRLVLVGNVDVPGEGPESGELVPERAIVLVGVPEVDPPPPSPGIPGAPAGEDVPVPTTQPAPAGSELSCMHALLSARLIRDEEHGFIAQRGSYEYIVVWPYGYVARDTSDGRVLIDSIGQVVAREGDYVQLSGGYGDEGFVTCGFPPAFDGDIDCELPGMDCYLALAAARRLVPVSSDTQVLARWGRMLGLWHTEVHVSIDGQPQIFDVMGPRDVDPLMLDDVSAAFRAGDSPVVVSGPAGREVGVPGIHVTLPPGWTYRLPTFVSWGPARPVIYFSNQPMHDECVRTGHSETCDRPIDALEPDGVLIEWWVSGEYAYPTPQPLPPGAPYEVAGLNAVRHGVNVTHCVPQATDAELIVFRRSDQALDQLTVCSRIMTDATRVELDELLASIEFPGPASD